MTPRRTLPMLVALTFAAGLVACGDDDASNDTEPDDTAAQTSEPSDGTVSSDTTGGPTGTSTPVSVNEEFAAFCGPMEELANFNEQAPTPEPGGSFEDLQEMLLSVQDRADGLYEAALDTAPAEIEDDLQRLSDYTDETFEVIADSDSAEEIFEFLTETPEDVLEATTNLNTFIKENCGFELTSGL